MAPSGKRTKSAAPVDISRFLDIEALHDDADESDDPGSDDGGFLAAEGSESPGPSATSSHPRFIHALPRRENIEATAATLRQLADDVRKRHKASVPAGFVRMEDGDRTPEHWEKIVAPAGAGENDAPLWGLDLVSQTSSHAVVMAIDERFGDMGSSPSLYSAFTHEDNSGIVYIETTLPLSSLEGILSGIAPTRHVGSNAPRLRFIPPEQRAALLCPPRKKMEMLHDCSWVRVDERGVYDGDMAFFTTQITPGVAEIVLVPRIRLLRNEDGNFSHKRPPRALFDERSVKNIYPARDIRRLPNCFEFKENTYDLEGYLWKTVQTANLLALESHPTDTELEWFETCASLTVKVGYTSAINRARLRVNDRVRIHSGQLRGQTGQLIDIDVLEIATIKASDSSDKYEVPANDVERLFMLGDSVKVISGNHVGVSGFIIEHDDKTAAIYDSSRVSSDVKTHAPIPEDIRVNLTSLDWDLPPSSVSPTGVIEQPVTAAPASAMHTGDPYRHMEVIIQKGQLKGHQATVLGSQFDDEGRSTVVVKTSSQAINTRLTFKIDDLKHMRTGLPLSQTRWVPQNIMPAWEEPSYRDTALTPMHSTQERFPSPAWDPANHAGESSHSTSSSTSPGTWLLDDRLVRKRIDVYIEGTLNDLHRGGSYEHKKGFTVLSHCPKNTDTFVWVMLGLEHTKIKFRVRHLCPEKTTELEGVVTKERAQRLDKASGTSRVLIIGPDVRGDEQYIGTIGWTIMNHQYPLLPKQVCVYLGTTYGYFFLDSLCRSYHDPVQWEGSTIY